MKITARLGGYSSVVGQSILLQDETQRVVCQLALLNVGSTLERSHKELCNEYGMHVVEAVNRKPASDMIAYKIKDSRGEYWQTTFEGKLYNFRQGDPFTPTRWVDTRERHPAVGGTYFTGQWYGLTNGLKHFRIKRLYFIIHKGNSPQWYSFEKSKGGSQKPAFPKCWLEGMPLPPPDDQT